MVLQVPVLPAPLPACCSHQLQPQQRPCRAHGLSQQEKTLVQVIILLITLVSTVVVSTSAQKHVFSTI